MRGRHAMASRHVLDPFCGKGRYGSALVTGVLGVCAAALLASAAATLFLGVTVHTVLTGSMSGSFEAGSVVLARTIPASEVRSGQVLVFTPPGSQTPYTHRVVSVENDAVGPVIRTKGDANPSPDPWRARLVDAQAHEVFVALPRVGDVLEPLRDGDVRVVAFALLGAVIAVTGARSVLGRPVPRSHRQPA